MKSLREQAWSRSCRSDRVKEIDLEKLFGPLGAFIVIVGAIMAFDGFSGDDQVFLISGVALVVSGLYFLALYEVVKVLKDISDNTYRTSTELYEVIEMLKYRTST